MNIEHIGPGTEVVLCGVASNFCDYDAMLGYLQRGAMVVVLQDLTQGIPLSPETRDFLLQETGFDRTLSGDMAELLQTPTFKPYVEAGMLRMENALDFLKRIQKPRVFLSPAP